MSTREAIWAAIFCFFAFCILIMISAERQREFELAKLRIRCPVQQESRHE